ncbi:hypothetical protein SK128_026694 [Halocaridina rubra]|uniref:Peptidase S1 domain-containing protein n=1 Tax=Halocaridina rubra TaxID=373956 RepID=A0AAN8WNU7_HALRR
MNHHVGFTILLTLTAVLGGHLHESFDLLDEASSKKGHHELISSSSDETSSLIRKPAFIARETSSSYHNDEDEDSFTSQELELSRVHELDLSSSLDFDPSPTHESTETAVVRFKHSNFNVGFSSRENHGIIDVSGEQRDIVRRSSISTTEENFPFLPFKASPIDHYASSQSATFDHQINNDLPQSSLTLTPYLNSSVSGREISNTQIQNTATLSQEEFSSILTRFSLDALQATQIAERLGIAGSAMSEIEKEFVFKSDTIKGPNRHSDRPYALPLQRRNSRTKPHRRNADFSRATRRLIFGDPSLCYTGSCEFFLLCWLKGGLIDGGCGGFLFACCNTASQRGQRGHDTSYRDGADLIPIDYGPILNDDTCGLSASNRLSAQRRIVGGTEAGFGSFPWQAYIRIGTSRCGGSLINQYHVVTAGHCVARARAGQIRVTLGDYVLNSNQEPLSPKIYGASEIKVHPNFKFTPQADRFDVAVITLDSPVRYEPHIQPICLPEKGTDWLGSYAWAAGWGALQSGSRLRPKTLQVVDVPILDSRLCEDWHRQKGINVIIYEEMMCAGYGQGGKDSCQGDSGGPLMIQDGGRWYLAGIVSAGYSCAQAKQPGIYHKVSYTSDWISWAANS